MEALLKRLGDEIELIFRYGSRLKGTAHRYSDLDISYVPAHESTWDSITVMVDDMLCDLYAIHWSKLERMAEFEDPSGTLLHDSRIVYERSEASGVRFRALAARHGDLQRPEARPETLRKAQDLFRTTGYPYYLLRRQAAEGRMLASLQQAKRILDIVLHCLMVCNQTPIDTRSVEPVLALPRLPADLAMTVERLRTAREPGALLSACDTLLDTTRELLLSEQRQVLRRDTTLAEMLEAAYPELKNDLQHILLACERGEASGLSLVSLHHELMIHLAQADTGVEYSSFNSLAEYQQPFAALGFPDLLPYALAGDFAGLHEQCLAFDRHLRRFLAHRSVPLETYATVEELEAHLAAGA